MGANDVELPSDGNPYSWSWPLSAWPATSIVPSGLTSRSTTRAVPRILDHGDLATGRDVEHLGHDGESIPGCHGETATRSRPTNATPSPQTTFRSVRSWTRANVRSTRPVRTSQTRTCAIGAERREARPVRAEPGGEDAAAMRAEDTNRIAGGGVPEPYDAVGVSGCDELPVRAVPDGEDFACVPDEPRERPAGEHVTDAHRLPVGHATRREPSGETETRWKIPFACPRQRPCCHSTREVPARRAGPAGPR